MTTTISAGLLLIDFNRVAFFHFQRSWGIIFVYWLTIEAESHYLHGQSLEKKKQEFSGLGRELNVLFATYRSVTICVHKLAEWSVFLNFKLHYCIVLS